MSSSTAAAITLAHRLVPSTEVLYQQVEGEGVLLDLASERYFGLNAVGAAAWSLLEAKPDLKAVAVALGEAFDAPAAVIEADLLALAEQLRDAGLATIAA